jgi:hypothetical protein
MARSGRISTAPPGTFIRRMTLGDMNATASRFDLVECAGAGG